MLQPSVSPQCWTPNGSKGPSPPNGKIQTYIAIKELLPIVLASRIWGPTFANKRIYFLCDNMAIVSVINSQTSKNSQIMQLVRELVLTAMSFNIHFKAKHIPGKTNIIADKLSRFQNQEARQLAPHLAAVQTNVSDDLLPWRPQRNHCSKQPLNPQQRLHTVQS